MRPGAHDHFISFRSLAEKVEPVKFASHLGGGHTRRVCAGTGVGTGGYPVTDPAHTIPIPERDARCQGLSAGGSCRIWLRSSPQSCLLTAAIIQRSEADLGWARRKPGVVVDVIMIAFHIRQATLLAEVVVVVVVASMLMILQWENCFVIRGKRSRGATWPTRTGLQVQNRCWIKCHHLLGC